MDLLYLYCHSYTTTNTRTRGVGVAFNSSTRGISPYHYDNANAHRQRRGGLASIIIITFTTLPLLVDGDEEDRHRLRHCNHSSTATRRSTFGAYSAPTLPPLVDGDEASTATRTATRRISTNYDTATTRRWRRGGLAFTTNGYYLTALPLVDDNNQNATIATLEQRIILFDPAACRWRHQECDITHYDI